jgi:hypothetical protein
MTARSLLCCLTPAVAVDVGGGSLGRPSREGWHHARTDGEQRQQLVAASAFHVDLQQRRVRAKHGALPNELIVTVP